MTDKLLRIYLGDGLYCEFDGYMVTLRTLRLDATREHWVCLEPEVMQAFLDWIKALMLAHPEQTDRWMP